MTRRIFATVFTLLLVTSAALAGAPGAVAAQEDESDEDDELEPADDAFVTDDGDVILVYANDSEGSQTEFGVDVSQSLLYALVVTNDSDATGVRGEATALLFPDRIEGNGSLVAERPDELSSLSVRASATQNDENARADASLEATISNRNATSAGLVRTADATGEFRIEPNAFAADASFDADLVTQVGQPRHEAFSLQESESGYTLQAARNYTLSSYEKERWNTSERARQTLEAQYGSVAQSLGGSAEVTLESYEYTNTSEGARLDVEFTVEYTDIEEGLRTQLINQLLNSPEYNLTRREAAEVATGIVETEVDEVSVTYEQAAGNIQASFTARLSDYDGAVRGLITVGQSFEPQEGDPNLSDTLARAEKSFEARQAAGLVQTYGFDLSLRQPDRETTELSADFSYRTENWAAYVEELKTRGIDPASSTFELTAGTENDEVTVDATFTVEQEDLLERAGESVLNASDESVDAETRRFVQALGEAGFEKGRMDVALTEDGQVRIEAGATFENLAAVRDALRAEGTLPGKVSTVVGRTEGNTTVTYVRLEEAVSPDASESEVRELKGVGEDTTVHLPGSYDRTFPTPDNQRAREYLGLTPTPSPTPTDAATDGGAGTETGTGQPGFGALAALIALAAAALIAARRP